MRMQTASDRRIDPRLRAKERALVMLGAEGELITAFHLVDISQGGLAFRYIGKKPRIEGLRRVSLSFDEEVWLRDVPVEAVCDSALDDGFIPFRRCGMRFGDFSEEERRRLDLFIGLVGLA